MMERMMMGGRGGDRGMMEIDDEELHYMMRKFHKMGMDVDPMEMMM